VCCAVSDITARVLPRRSTRWCSPSCGAACTGTPWTFPGPPHRTRPGQGHLRARRWLLPVNRRASRTPLPQRATCGTGVRDRAGALLPCLGALPSGWWSRGPAPRLGRQGRGEGRGEVRSQFRVAPRSRTGAKRSWAGSAAMGSSRRSRRAGSSSPGPGWRVGGPPCGGCRSSRN